jgi:dihydrofolate reductase
MINAIFAADMFGGMGYQGTLPWAHNSNDLKHFKKLTEGHIVVMGRRTYDDPKMPKPLQDRTVYVVSNRMIPDSVYQLRGNIVDQILKLEQANPDKTIWVVGGADVLEQCESIYDRIYLTHFKGSYKIDTKVNLKSLLSGRLMHSASAAPEDNCTFVVYESIFRKSRPST